MTPPTPDAAGGGPGTGGGPLGKLPSQVPSGVKNLLDGIFNWGGDMGRGFGEFVAGLAESIGGGGDGGGGAAMMAPDAMQLVADVGGVVL